MTSAHLPTLLALRIDLATVKVQQQLSAAGVPVLLLKGPTTAAWLYGDGTARGYTDSDLLVPPDKHAQARDVLLAAGYSDVHAGYRPSERNSHADTLLGPLDGGVLHAVDLHHRVELTGGAAASWRVWWQHRAPFNLCGTAILQLDEPARAVVAALHAVQSGYADTKALADLRRARLQVAAPVWQQAAALATALGAADAFSLAEAMASHDADSLTTTADWAAASPELRGRVLRDPQARGVRALLELSRNQRRWQRIVDELAPSSPRLRELHGPGPTWRLRLRHVRALAEHGGAALSQVRVLRR